jgi:hypothetical protein
MITPIYYLEDNNFSAFP